MTDNPDETTDASDDDGIETHTLTVEPVSVAIPVEWNEADRAAMTRTTRWHGLKDHDPTPKENIIGGRPPTKHAGGRPKGVKDSRHVVRTYAPMAITQLARSLAPEALERLVQIAKYGKNEAAAVKACEALLNRAYGKPAIQAETRAELPAQQIQIVFGDTENIPSVTVIDKTPAQTSSNDGDDGEE